jgi:hypothetical protein
MKGKKTAVTADVVLLLLAPGAEPVPLPAQFRYDPEDPYAVTVLFMAGRGTQEWMFARDLLSDGLLTPSGLGDLKVRPDPENVEQVLLELDSPGGFAIMSGKAEHICEFLDRTYYLVGPGEEDLWINFDRELEKLTSTN